MRGDTHLRHHGQWRTCVKAACNAAALVASPQSQMKTSPFRQKPEMTPPRRKVGCKNSHKTDEVQPGGREWCTKTDPGRCDCCKNLLKTDQGATLRM